MKRAWRNDASCSIHQISLLISDKRIRYFERRVSQTDRKTDLRESSIFDATFSTLYKIFGPNKRWNSEAALFASNNLPSGHLAVYFDTTFLLIDIQMHWSASLFRCFVCYCGYKVLMHRLVDCCPDYWNWGTSAYQAVSPLYVIDTLHTLLPNNNNTQNYLTKNPLY